MAFRTFIAGLKIAKFDQKSINLTKIVHIPARGTQMIPTQHPIIMLCTNGYIILKIRAYIANLMKVIRPKKSTNLGMVQPIYRIIIFR